jgi:hypothetical protein
LQEVAVAEQVFTAKAVVAQVELFTKEIIQ